MSLQSKKSRPNKCSQKREVSFEEGKAGLGKIENVWSNAVKNTKNPVLSKNGDAYGTRNCAAQDREFENNQKSEIAQAAVNDMVSTKKGGNGFIYGSLVTRPKHDAPNLPAHFLLPLSSPLKVHKLYADFRTLCGNSRQKIFEPLYQEFMGSEEFDSIDAIEVKIKLLLSQMEIRRQQIVSIARPNEEGAVNEVIAYVAEMDAWKEDIEDFMHWAFMGRDDLQHQLFSASGRLRHLLSR
ncbi:hypothetical protein F5879DRAFT_926005 [Lentinula edodes]|nr:hypothetical protein F5879DRAFT_926005 [Lentinula edodes]